MLLALDLVALESIGGAGLGYGVQENSAPGNVDVALSQERRELQL